MLIKSKKNYKFIGKRNQKGNEDPEKISLKRKHAQSTTKKVNKIQQMVSENDSSDEDVNSRPKKKIYSRNEGKEKNAFDIEEWRAYLEIEIEERKMSLRERDIALKRAAAELEAIELANKKTKLSLKK